MLTQSILVGLICMLGKLDWTLGMCFIDRPIILCPLVGLVMGDLSQGIILGIALELLFLGNMAVGAAASPDVTLGGVLGCAFSIHLGMGAEVALAVALPIAILSSFLDNTVFQTVLNVSLVHRADRYADDGDTRGVASMHILAGMLRVVFFGLMGGVAFYAGQGFLENVVDRIPAFILVGANVVAGMLPAIGFALLIRLMVNKRVVPFLFLGYLLAAYLQVPIIGIAIFGVIAALILVSNQNNQKSVATENGGTLDDF